MSCVRKIKVLLIRGDNRKKILLRGNSFSCFKEHLKTNGQELMELVGPQFIYQVYDPDFKSYVNMDDDCILNDLMQIKVVEVLTENEKAKSVIEDDVRAIDKINPGTSNCSESEIIGDNSSNKSSKVISSTDVCKKKTILGSANRTKFCMEYCLPALPRYVTDEAIYSGLIVKRKDQINKEIVSLICHDLMEKYSLYPPSHLETAKTLVRKYPHLEESPGCGFEFWRKRLATKFKNFRRGVKGVDIVDQMRLRYARKRSAADSEEDSVDDIEKMDGDSVEGIFGNSVEGIFGNSVEEIVGDNVEEIVKDRVENIVENSVEKIIGNIRYRVENSVEDSVENSVEDSVENSVEDSVEKTVEDSVEKTLEDSVEKTEDSVESSKAARSSHGKNLLLEQGKPDKKANFKGKTTNAHCRKGTKKSKAKRVELPESFEDERSILMHQKFMREEVKKKAIDPSAINSRMERTFVNRAMEIQNGAEIKDILNMYPAIKNAQQIDLEFCRISKSDCGAEEGIRKSLEKYAEKIWILAANKKSKEVQIEILQACKQQTNEKRKKDIRKIGALLLIPSLLNENFKNIFSAEKEIGSMPVGPMIVFSGNHIITSQDLSLYVDRLKVVECYDLFSAIVLYFSAYWIFHIPYNVNALVKSLCVIENLFVGMNYTPLLKQSKELIDSIRK